MTLTPEEIQKYSSMLNQSSTQVSSQRTNQEAQKRLASYRGTAQTAPVPEVSATQKLFGTGIIGKGVEMFTGAEANLGKDIGRGLLGGDKYFQKIQDQYTENVNTLTNLAAKQSDPAMKQKYLDMAKQDFEAGQKVGVDFKGRSWEQIAGDIAGVALDVGTTISGLGAVKAIKGAQAATTGQKILKGAVTGAKTGGKLGVGYGIAGGMQEDKDIGGVAGEAVTGGLIGAATGGVLGAGTAAASEAYQGIKNKIVNRAEIKADKDLAKIEEMITPAPTKSEVTKAQAEGRLIKGQKETLFKSSKPDILVPSDDTIRATSVIKRNIPDAAKLDEGELVPTIKNKIGEISNKLKPEMQKVPVTENVLTKLDNEISNVHEKQIGEVLRTDEPNVQKMQEKFMANLKKYILKDGEITMNDIWEARYNYDKSIKNTVKQADSKSPHELQLAKDIWLQNRTTLNNAINDMSTGLGETSKKSFSDMSDMYNAVEAMLSKSKKVIKEKPSKIVQTIKKHPVASSLIGGGTAYGAAKKMGIPLP